MEINEKNELIQIGAKVPAALAIKFRNYCKTNPHKFDQRQLFENIAKWWLGEDISIQEHIYRGRFLEAHRQIAESLADTEAAKNVVARQKARLSKPKQKQEKKSSKTG